MPKYLFFFINDFIENLHYNVLQYILLHYNNIISTPLTTLQITRAVDLKIFRIRI